MKSDDGGVAFGYGSGLIIGAFGCGWLGTSAAMSLLVVGIVFVVVAMWSSR